MGQCGEQARCDGFRKWNFTLRWCSYGQKTSLWWRKSHSFFLASWFFLLLASTISALGYEFSTEALDVIIPCHSKDQEKLEYCINGIRENGENIGRIFVISNEPYTSDAEWVDEADFPFTKKDVVVAILKKKAFAEFYLSKNTDKAGWVYQQLLKFYAFLVIEDLSSNILILDADTIFLNPVSFINDEGEAYYNPCHRDPSIYHRHMKKFVPDLVPFFREVSGVTHHMVMQQAVLSDLFSVVEAHHKAPFWKAFCSCMNLLGDFPSEYEIYFHFLFTRTDQCHLRPLKWKDSGEFHRREAFKEEGYHYVSFHSYLN